MIHQAVKLLRKYHNIKQKTLAERLGIGQSHLSEIENGNKSISYELLEKYSDVFGVPVSAISFFSEIHEESDANRKSFPVKVTGKALQILEWIDSIRDFDERSTSKTA